MLPSFCENENDELSTSPSAYWTWGCRYNLRLRKQAVFLSQTMYRRNMHWRRARVGRKVVAQSHLFDPISDRNLVKSRHLCVVTLCTYWRHANEGKASLIPLTWRPWPPLIMNWHIRRGHGKSCNRYASPSCRCWWAPRSNQTQCVYKLQPLLTSISRTVTYPNSHGN